MECACKYFAQAIKLNPTNMRALFGLFLVSRNTFIYFSPPQVRKMLLTVSVFYHLGGVNVFHHDIPAFSVSGHLWVDAIDAHVTLQSVQSSHLWTSSGSCSRHLHT